LEFLKYWPVLVTLINWLLKSKCMLKLFFLWRYNMIFLLLYIFRETWSYAWKQNILFYFIFLMKTRYLIPDLYLYSIKIQTNIDPNAVKYLWKITDFWKEFFLFFLFFGLGPTRPMWLGWAQLACVAGLGWLTGPRQWPAPFCPCTRNILRVHEQCEGN